MNKKIAIKIEAGLEDLSPGFLDRKKKEMPILITALKNRDFLAIESMGHKLKGSAGGYGFHHMGTYGANIEKYAKEKNEVELEKQIKELEQYLFFIEIIFETAA